MKKELMIIITLGIMIGLALWANHLEYKMPTHNPHYPTPLPIEMEYNYEPDEPPEILTEEPYIC